MDKSPVNDKVKSVYFLPKGKSLEELAGKGIVDEIPDLGELWKAIQEQFRRTGAKTWEISVEGTLEVGFVVGPKASFKATLTLSNKNP